MASSNTGANFFIQQVRTVAESNADLSTSDPSDVEKTKNHAPYKGYKQTGSSSKFLSGMAKQLQGDFKKIQESYNKSTNWIGTARNSPEFHDLGEDTTKPLESLYSLNSKAPKDEPLELHNSTEETNASSLGDASLATGTEIKGAQTNGTKSPTPKIKLRKSTKNNGVTKSVAPKKVSLKLKLKLSEEDEAKLKPNTNLSPWDLLPLDKKNHLRRWEDLPSLEQEETTPTPRILHQLERFSCPKVTTDFQPIEWDAETSVGKEQPINQQMNNFNPWDQPRDKDSGYYKTTSNEITRPSWVNSQVSEELIRLATRTPTPLLSYEQRLSKKTDKAVERAQKFVDLKSKIATIARANEEYTQISGQPSRIEQRHILTALPSHMRMVKKHSDAITRADGRIEYGTERKWTAPKRNFEEIFSSNSDSDIKQESPPNKRLQITINPSGKKLASPSPSKKTPRIRVTQSGKRLGYPSPAKKIPRIIVTQSGKKLGCPSPAKKTPRIIVTESGKRLGYPSTKRPQIISTQY